MDRDVLRLNGREDRMELRNPTKRDRLKSSSTNLIPGAESALGCIFFASGSGWCLLQPDSLEEAMEGSTILIRSRFQAENALSTVAPSQLTLNPKP